MRYIKKIAILTLFAILVSSFNCVPAVAVAQSNNIDLTYGISEVDGNGNFTVAVNFENNTGITGYKLNFKFDSTVIVPVSVAVGTAFNSGNFTDTIGKENTQFNVLWSNLQNVNADGTAFTITFKRLKEVPSVINVSYSQPDTFDEDFNDVALNISDINLGSGTPVVSDGINVTYEISEVDSNSNFTVAVNFENNTGITGYKLNFKFDSTVVVPVSAAVGTAFNSGNFTDTIGRENTQFNVLWSNLQNVNADGTAFTITFKRLKEASSVINVSYSQPDTFDENFNDVVLNISDIQISQSAAFTTIKINFKNYFNSALEVGELGVYDADNGLLKKCAFANETVEINVARKETYNIVIKPKNSVSLKIYGVKYEQLIDLNAYLILLNGYSGFDVSKWPIGDINFDEVVDIADLSTLLKSDVYSKTNAEFDLNGDSSIDISDISIVLNEINFGKPSFSVNAEKLA